ncbi:hypothetical protein SAMN04487762_0079 [Polaribacter sp. Hel1_33_78]|jgi:hypothetical protein|uniref:hypothetical protein n=1 Tax=unclassified Polaribacter TaxID=196858 RepID=UPI00087AD13C|nr:MULTISPECIES: hypothetical protein [unclassified Polaribacter]MDG1194402.1 hypothetical protein [Polaribacter sp.]MDG1402290.1 hypothetical protein [Polaribacter sp.]MDG2436407.1 hypothetical protein [Polaribacter sp.]SDT86793.1 hypothetical protein SAMN04487762_0079 [Polaribacter sp. Hel1_33_78]
MNTAVETTFVAPYHQLNKKTLFDSNKRYYTFINWVSGEFDLYLQDESNGLHVYFPEGKFHITNEVDNGNIIVQINLQSKILENGQLIFNKIMSVYNLLSKK